MPQAKILLFHLYAVIFALVETTILPFYSILLMMVLMPLCIWLESLWSTKRISYCLEVVRLLERVNGAWDTKWVVESKIHDDHYILEIYHTAYLLLSIVKAKPNGALIVIISTRKITKEIPGCKYSSKSVYFQFGLYG